VEADLNAVGGFGAVSPLSLSPPPLSGVVGSHRTFFKISDSQMSRKGILKVFLQFFA